MSWIFPTSSYLVNSTIYTGGPYSFGMCFSAWVNVPGFTVQRGVFSAYIDGNNNYGLIVRINTNGTVAAIHRTSGNDATSTSSNTMTDNTWHHIYAVWSAQNNRRVWLNGVAGSASTANRSLDNSMNRIVLGAGHNLNNQFLNSRMAEAAYWNTALSDKEIAELAAGKPPGLIRPDNQLFYFPFLGEKQDFRKNTWSAPGTDSSRIIHPRILYS